MNFGCVENILPFLEKNLCKRSALTKYGNLTFNFPLFFSHCVLCGVQKLILGCGYCPSLLLEVFLSINCSKTVSQIDIVRGSMIFGEGQEMGPVCCSKPICLLVHHLSSCSGLFPWFK